MSMTEDSSIHSVYFRQRKMYGTGESINLTYRDTLFLSEEIDSKKGLLYQKNGHYKIPESSHSVYEILDSSDSTFQIRRTMVFGKKSLGDLSEYQLLEEIPYKYTSDDFFTAIVGNDYEEYKSQDSVPNQKKIFFRNKKRIRLWEKEEEKKKLTSFIGTNWQPLDEQYIVLDFNGFLIYKGVNGNPKIVTKISEEEVEMVEYVPETLERKVTLWRKIN